MPDSLPPMTRLPSDEIVFHTMKLVKVALEVSNGEASTMLILCDVGLVAIANLVVAEENETSSWIFIMAYDG